MTLEISNMNNLPPELINYIYEFDRPYIDYINKYDILSWEKMRKRLRTRTYYRPSFIVKAHQIIQKINPSIYTFKIEKWMYYDYMKMHPGKKYFWNDECTDYDKYNEKLLEFLQACDELIYTDEKYYSKLSSINELYELILKEINSDDDEDDYNL